MRTETTKAIYRAALQNKNIIFLTGDLDHEAATEFKENIPDQHINIGLAEQNMVGIAAGLALSGKKVFVFSITPFVTMRCFEQIRVDVCYQNLDVTIIGVGGGFAYSTSGCTHHAIEDIAMMRALPNMKIFSPCHPLEARLITEKLIHLPGPNYLRIGRKNDPLIPELAQEKSEDIKLGQAMVVRPGNTISIFCTGSIMTEALAAAKELDYLGWSAEVINMHTLKPFDTKIITKRLENRLAIFSLEEHSIMGGLGSIISEAISEVTIKPMIMPLFKRFGVEDRFTHIIGPAKNLRKDNRIDSDSLVKRIKQLDNSLR